MHRMGAFAMPVERSADFGAALRRLLGLLRRERAGMTAVVVLAIASASLSVSGPRLLGQATDVIVQGVVSGAGIDFASLARHLLLVLAVYVGSAILLYIQALLLTGIVQRTMFGLRAEVEAKLHRLPLEYIDHHARGDLLSRVTNDVDNLAQSLQQTLSQMLQSTLVLVGTVAMMVWISWQLALVALVTLPASLFAMRFIARRSRPRFIAQWRHTGALNGLVEETFTGHAVVRAFGRERDAEERFRTINEQLYEASFGAQFISSSIQPTMMAIGNLNFVAVCVFGGLRVASGAMTIGDVQALIQYSRQLTQPLTQVASMVNVFQSGVASAERIFELLDAPEETHDPPAPVLRGAVEGRIAFHDVSFSYTPEQPLIEDLSLHVEPGYTVAIVGPTGAGKTTLVNLIMRFYELDAGAITLDDVPIASLQRSELRSSIGMVLQDTWLFEGTIRDNIAYGRPGASEAEIVAAARATYVDRFVHALPDGYDTVVADEGGALSQGEKQLITIARAFLAEPDILILDEATSSVDTRTEVLIQHAMAALRADRTSFVIAHRLSTIRDAHTILVMEDGRIVEQGDHPTLLAAGGAYALLYNAQFVGPTADVL